MTFIYVLCLEIFQNSFAISLQMPVMHRKTIVLFKISVEAFVENNDLTNSLLWCIFYNSDQYCAITSLLSCSCDTYIFRTLTRDFFYLNTTLIQIKHNGKILNIHIEMVLTQWPQQSWITYIYTHAYIQWSSYTKMKSLHTATFIFFL